MAQARSGLAILTLRSEGQKVHYPAQTRSLGLVDTGVLKIMREVVSGKRPWPLYFCGGVGVGKTCAALALLDYCQGKYWPLPELCEELIVAGKGRLTARKDARSWNVWPEMIWEAVQNYELVAVDELGTRESVSDFQYETLKRVLDDRLNKPLILISNLPLDRLERLCDARIVSRIAAGTVVEIQGRDRRITK